jgi:hypothetical protein
MNPTTFNDGLARALAAFPHQAHLRVLGDWQSAPLFDYVTTYEHERDLIKRELGGLDAWNIQAEALEEMQMPFETFRLAVTETAVPWKDGNHELGHGTYRTNMIIARERAEMFVVVEIKELWDREERHRAGYPVLPMPLYLIIANLRHDPNGKTDGAYFYNSALWVDGKWVSLDDSVSPGVQQLVSGAIGAIAAFLFDANMPTTHIATVRPNKQGKSVEWVRARSHYTLICHGHPANKKDIAEGARVTVDRDEEIKRMAHDRRAHDVTYRHQRYTYARGQTRRRRATWVGPKEWMDIGGKQIYRILEPVGGAPDCVLTSP